MPHQINLCTSFVDFTDDDLTAPAISPSNYYAPSILYPTIASSSIPSCIFTHSHTRSRSRDSSSSSTRGRPRHLAPSAPPTPEIAADVSMDSPNSCNNSTRSSSPAKSVRFSESSMLGSEGLGIVVHSVMEMKGRDCEGGKYWRQGPWEYISSRGRVYRREWKPERTAKEKAGKEKRGRERGSIYGSSEC